MGALEDKTLHQTSPPIPSHEEEPPSGFPPSELFGSGFTGPEGHHVSPPDEFEEEKNQPSPQLEDFTSEVTDAFFSSSGNNKKGSANNNLQPIPKTELKNNNIGSLVCSRGNNGNSFGHVRSSSLADGSAFNRVRMLSEGGNGGRSSANGGHVRTGSGSSAVALGFPPVVSDSGSNKSTIVAQQQPPAVIYIAGPAPQQVIPKTAVLKANNPFLSDMTPEELAMANLDLSAIAKVQEEDLLNFSDVPTTISERNKHASAHIMQMFTTAAADPVLARSYPTTNLTTNQNSSAAFEQPPKRPPKPSAVCRKTDSPPPVLPPKPLLHNPVHQSIYKPNVTVPAVPPHSNYHNINYSKHSAGAVAGSSYDALTVMRHQQLLQEQQSKQPQQPPAEDWLMSQLP